MESKPTLPPEAPASAARPGLDVKPPAPAAEAPAEPMAVPPPDGSGTLPAPLPAPKPAPHETERPKLQKPARVKTADHNVTTAIIATVIIILGLAALAVFAYLQQK